MTTAELFIKSEQALDNVIQQIRDDHWGMKIPEWFQVGSSQDRSTLDLKTLINYHAYDTAWVPDTLSGKTMAEVGSKWDGDLLGDDPRGSYHALSLKAIEVVQALDDPNQPVHLTYGDFPAHEYLRHTASFRGFRTFDLAKLIGVDAKLSDDLVQGMWELLTPDMEAWRQIGVYGPTVAVPAEASLQDRLIGLSGRDPKVSA